MRDFTSSLRNALRRWYSTVLGLMNSCAAISRLVCPCAARRETCASCGVSWSSVSHGPFAGALAGRLQLDPGALGERLHPEVGEELVGDSQLACVRQGAGVRVAATRRRADAPARGPTRRRVGWRRSIASRYSVSAASPRLRSARDRASTPSAHGCRWRGSIRSTAPGPRAAGSLRPLRLAASISSTAAKVENHSSCGSAAACAAAAKASS